MNKTKLAKIGVATATTGLFGAGIYNSYSTIGEAQPVKTKVMANRIAYVSTGLVAVVWFLTLN